MKNIVLYQVVLFAIVCLAISPATTQEKGSSPISSFEHVSRLFSDPPVSYRSAPLWVWNDDVTEEEIDRQLVELQSAGIGGVFIHPRPGLITPYLSDRWFSLCRYTVDKAKELGMEVWLYDENSYPSGFAGGHVPAEMPQSYNQGQGLVMQQADRLPDNAEKKYYLVLKKEGASFTDVTDRLVQEKNKTGDYFLFEKSYYEKSPWYGGFSYVDLLHEGVTEKFIELTMTGYKKAIGDEFGKLVPGIFTDEPHIRPPAGTKWTPDLFAEFEQRWGYDLKVNLPLLFLETGNWKRIRHNYYALLLELFIDRWSKLWYDYCEKNDLQWTGHYWEHGWPNPLHCIDNMALYAWHQVPAIDILMNKYSEDVNAQFGNVRAVKELRSVANQMGRSRTLSETYGAGGWDLRFEDMKRIGDWEYVLGVNFLNQHLSYITIKGARKRDHPQSFSYHEPWWKFYHVLGDYFARLSLALSSGEQVNRVLVIEPTTTAWMYFSRAQSPKKYSRLGPLFQNFVFVLEKHQVEYDLGSENVIKNNGKVIDGRFVVGKRNYEVVVLPPGLENLDASTFELIKQYLDQGGKVLSFTDEVKYVDGTPAPELEILIREKFSQWHHAASLSDPQAAELLASDQITFYQPEKIAGKLFHHRRELTDGQLLFLVNTSADEWATGKLTIKGRAAVELDLLNGQKQPYPTKTVGKSVELQFDLPPVGSLLLFVDHATLKKTVAPKQPIVKILQPSGKLNIQRTALNALTLDYCDLKINNGKQEKDIYFFRAADKIFKHYGFRGNPWSRAVQYKSSLIDRNNFPHDSGFEASYSFFVADGANKTSLRAVVERPELWKISVNGTIVAPLENETWLDRAFGVFEIGKYVKDGINTITLIASPMTVHSELEPIYIIGDFSLESMDKGWKIVPTQSLSLGKWNEQGMPFYADAVSYTQIYHLQPGQKRYVVKLVDWQGSVVEVLVNKKNAGIIAWAPHELDITDVVQPGENEISVVVYGTLKNLLGPHHSGKIRGAAWPSSFETAEEKQPAGIEYDVIGYGLFQDYLLIEATGAAKKVYWRNYSVAKPVISAAEHVSINAPITVSLSSKTEGAEIRYTLDGSVPNKSSLLYTGPVVLEKSVTLRAKAFKPGLIDSKIAQQTFSIINSKKNGLNYRYFEGNWENIPDVDTLTPVKTGRVYEFSLSSVEPRQECFAVEFSGYLQIEQAGEYKFFTESNDGSILMINGMKVVNNDGLHSAQERGGKIKLKLGRHSIRLIYFDGGGSQSLKVSFQGPGIHKQIVPAHLLYYR